MFVNIGPRGSENFKRCSTYRSQPNVLKLFLEFLANGPRKATFEILKILKIKIYNDYFFVFVNMEPNGSEIFKTLLLLQIATCPEFTPNSSHKTTFGIFEILSFRFLTISFSKISNLPL